MRIIWLHRCRLLQEQITAIQLENEEASNEVERLAAEQRVTSISSTALTYQGNNVVTIDEDK
jgi:cell division protein FtsL